MKKPLQVGDRVAIIGTVQGVSGNGSLAVINEMGFPHWVPSCCCRHLKPKKKKVKKSRQVWVNVYPDRSTVYPSQQEADSVATQYRVACIPVSLDWEEETP